MSSLHVNSRLILKNFLSLTLSGDMSISASYTEISSLISKTKIGTKLTISNGKVKIGSGVKTIKISGIIGLNSASSTTYYMWPRKNSTNTGAWQVVSNVTGFYSFPVDQTIVVQENDIITLSLYSNVSANIEAQKTNINIEVIK